MKEFDILICLDCESSHYLDIAVIIEIYEIKKKGYHYILEYKNKDSETYTYIELINNFKKIKTE